MARPTLLVALIVVLAGCASVGQENGPEESRATPTPTTPTQERTPLFEDQDEETDETTDEEGTNASRDDEEENETSREDDEDANESEDEEDTTVVVESEPEWPTNGSFVTYAVEGTSSVRGALRETDVEATWTWFDGEWQLDCEGEFSTSPRSVRDTVRWHNGTFAVMGDEETPRGATPLAEPNRRGSMSVWLLEDCEPDRTRFRNATTEDIEERRDDADEDETDEDDATRTQRTDGDAQRAFSGRTREILYDPDTGVVLSWREVGNRGKLIEGELVDTDAPIGR